jgi:hypothetical protein
MGYHYKIHEELEYIQNLKKQYGKTLPQLNKLEGVLLDEALQEYAALEVIVVDEQYGIDPLENEAEEEGDAGESKDVSEHFLTYIFELRDVVGDDDLELLELYKLQGSDYKEEEEDVTDIEDLFIEIRDLLESQQNLKIKFRNALHQVKDLDRRWLKHTLKVYAGLEVFVKEEVFGIKKDEEEEETDEEGDSDTDGDENEVEEEVSNGDDEGSVEEESEEVEVGDGDAEGSGDEEREEEDDVVLEPFWNFVFTARNAVDDDIVDIMDEYYSKGVNRVLKERENEEMEMDGDLWGEPEPEDQPQNIGKRVKDVLDITDAFEHSGPCCFETCSQRKIGSIGRMTEYILNNKETLQTHNPRIYEKVYKMLLPIKRSVKKIGDRKVTSHRKRKILQDPQVGRGLLTFLEKLALPTLLKDSKSANR